MLTFWRELRRRNVIQVGVAYFFVGWLLIEMASVVAPALLLPSWTDRLITVLVITGFPLALVLSWLFDVTPDGIRRERKADEDGLPEEPAPEGGVPASVPDSIAAVAVLPFDNLGDAADTYLGDGVATEIHDRLSKLQRLRIASRRSAFRFRDGDHSLGDIAQTLNVRYVLSGSVMRSDNKVRVIAELDDVNQDAQVWSQRFERELVDVLPMMAEIADAVVGAFGGKRQQLEMHEAGNRNTDDADAWQLVQSARSIVLSRGASAIDEAEQMLGRALELDPDYAVAQAALASVIAERILTGASESLDGDIERARRAIGQASELLPEDADVLKTSGMVLATIGEPGRAVEVLDHCIGLAPYDFGAWGYFGWPLTARGRQEDIDRLEEILERILSIAPDHPGVPYWLHHRSVAETCRNDLEAAREYSRQALAKHRGLPWIWMNAANVSACLGDVDAARSGVSEARKRNRHMTPEHYARQILLMSENGGFSEARTRGLREAGLIAAP